MRCLLTISHVMIAAISTHQILSIDIDLGITSSEVHLHGRLAKKADSVTH
jgi:hypothetical protein